MEFKKMKILNQIVPLMGLSLFLLSGTPAFADDDKVFIGAMCDWQTQANVPEYRWGQVLRNTTGSNQWTTCPLVRDSTSKSPEYFSITVQGAVSGPCWLDIRTANGGGIDNRVHQSTVNLGNGKTRFEWYKGNADGPSHNNAAYALACNLRPNSFIYSYSMSENE